MRHLIVILLLLSTTAFAETTNTLINEDILIGELLSENDFFIQDTMPSEEDFNDDMPIE